MGVKWHILNQYFVLKLAKLIIIWVKMYRISHLSGFIDDVHFQL